MEESIRNFSTEVGRFALARDWPAVHSMLASWLRSSSTPDDVREFFENEYRATLDANGIGDLHYPEHPDPDVGGNSFTNATSLREPISWEGGRIRPVAPEVTDENMKFWARMQLQCSDEQMEQLRFDYFAEVWMAVVETAEGLRVGYWSQGAY
ncbi:MAG TPA: hypothetical protein VKN18_25185 [Blastocatellia bacterium]|nr:hypothetical protein [Blastocatellia bacterium]